MISDMITGMHRTGHHAVAVWLFHQKPNVHDFSINTIASWLFSLTKGSGVHLYANNPLKTGPNEHPDKQKLPLITDDIQPDSLLVSHERESIEDCIKIAENSFWDFNKPIVVIRDFKNWVASCMKMALRDNKMVEEVINNDDVSLYKNHLINYPERTAYHIHYNIWAENPDYRQQICKDLGFTYTDAAKDQLSIFGGGSSFDGMDYIKNASDMKVNERYKEVETHPYYEMLISKHEEALALSNAIFQ